MRGEYGSIALLATVLTIGLTSCDRGDNGAPARDQVESTIALVAAAAKQRADSASAHCTMAREDSSSHMAEAEINALCHVSDSLLAVSAAAESTHAAAKRGDSTATRRP